MDQGNTQHTTNNNNQPQVNNNQDASTTTPSLGPTNTVGQVVIPYVQGTAKSFMHICGKYGIKVHFKGNTTIKQILMKPKDQDPMEKKSGVIYSYQCNNIDCDEEYIGKTARTLGERCKEYLKQPSPIHVYIQQTGHNITDTSFNIIGREDQGQARMIKESIYIRVNNPTLNINIGTYNLSHIWDRVLFNTPGLKLSSSQQTNALWLALALIKHEVVNAIAHTQSIGFRLSHPSIFSLQQSLVSIRHALNSEHVLIQHSMPYKCSNVRWFSDLMKCSVEHESLSLFQPACSE